MNSLILDDPGIFLGKHSQRLVLRKGGETLQEVPLFQVGQVIVSTQGATLSADAVNACAENGIPITFLGRRGEPMAVLSSPALTATVITRREQLRAYDDERGGILAYLLASGKIRNQINILRYFSKYRRARDPEVFAAVAERVSFMEALLEELASIPEAQVDSIRSRVLNIEGRAGAQYWEAVGALLAGRIDFPGASTGDDSVNAMLNYGYGVLYSQAARAHPGWIEPSRASCVDRQKAVCMSSISWRVPCSGDRPRSWR